MFVIQGLAAFPCVLQLGSKNSSNNWVDSSTPSPPAPSPLSCTVRRAIITAIMSDFVQKFLPNTGTLAGCNARLVASDFICALTQMHGGRPAERRTSDMTAFKALQERRESSPLFRGGKYLRLQKWFRRVSQDVRVKGFSHPKTFLKV